MQNPNDDLICEKPSSDCDCNCNLASYYNDKIANLEAMVKKYKFDYLTGLMGKRDCFEKMDILFEECINSDHSFYFGLIDLDNLHNINKKFGYYVGDESIKGVSDALRKRFLFHQIYRIGGDEFGVIIRADRISKKTIEDSLNTIAGITYYISDASGFVTAKQMFKCIDKQLIAKKKTEKRL